MDTMTMIMILMVAALAACLWLRGKDANLKTIATAFSVIAMLWKGALWGAGGLTPAANIAEGVHKGVITRKADAATTARYLCYKIGSDADHVAVTTAATEIPLGMGYDMADAAEDDIAIQLFGGRDETLLGVALAAITAGDYICAAADGKVQTMTGLASQTVYIIGRALTTAAAGGLVEFDPCVPVQRVIA